MRLLLAVLSALLAAGPGPARADSAAEDAGSAAEDAGSAAEDAGSAAEDAGSAAEDAGSAAGDATPARPGMHWAVAAGGFAGITGPADFGPAAEVHVYPGGAAGRLGAGLRYRGFAGTSSGLVALGVTYAAGVARPGLVIELHGEAGIAYGPDCIVAGGGARAQLGLWGPLTLAIDTAGHFLFAGADTRLAIAPTLTVGLSR